MSNGRASSPIGTPPTIGFPSGGGGSDGEGCAVIISLVLIFGIPLALLSFLHSKLGGAIFWYSGKMLLLTICITIIPTISASITRILLLRSFIDVFIFSLFLVGSLWIFNLSISTIWITYGVSVIAVLEFGGLLSKFNMNYTVAGIQRNTDDAIWSDSVAQIRKIVLYGELIYISIPLSMLSGTIVGMIRVSPPAETIKITILITLSVICIELFIIAIIEFVCMCHPFVYMKFSPSTELSTKINRACIIAEVRKIYLLDSIHSIVIFVGLSVIILKLANLTGSSTTMLLISLFIVLSFLFNQTPYIIGQSLMRRNLLHDVQGLRRAQALETLDKYAPLFPLARYITTISMSGTAGYFLFRFLEKIATDIIGKTIGKLW